MEKGIRRGSGWDWEGRQWTGGGVEPLDVWSGVHVGSRRLPTSPRRPSYWRVSCRIRDRPSPYEGALQQSRAAAREEAVVAGLDLPLVWWEKGRSTPLEEGSMLGRAASGGGTPLGSEGARPPACARSQRREKRWFQNERGEKEERPRGGSWLVWFGATSLGWGWSGHWMLVWWNPLVVVWARASTNYWKS
jgi:hypothetical protein